MAASAVVSAEEGAVDGSAMAIRTVVSGKTCVGDDVLTFGKSAPGSVGAFERVGRPAGTYSVGYGTILIRRDQDVHGHVASVSQHRHLSLRYVREAKDAVRAAPFAVDPS
jgi:hypothetical protein